jgi:hypothetical protein
MIVVARSIGLVLFGLGMIALEVRAFSEPWRWNLAQDVFVLTGFSILLGVLWAKGRRLSSGDMPALAMTQPEGRRAYLRNLLLWLAIAAALVALYHMIPHI